MCRVRAGWSVIMVNGLVGLRIRVRVRAGVGVGLWLRARVR